MRKLGMITKEEMDQLNALINERAALCDLILSMGRAKELGIDLDEDKIYKRLVNDMKMVGEKIGEWWKDTAACHNWEYQSGDTWNFDAHTREIFLTNPEN